MDSRAKTREFIRKAEGSSDWETYWDNVYRAAATLGAADGPDVENKIVSNLVSRMKKQPG
jgi:hypothetical protein